MSIRRRITLICGVLAVVFALQLLAGCSTTRNKRRGVKLSDAQREAAKGEEEKQRVLVEDPEAEDPEYESHEAELATSLLASDEQPAPNVPPSEADVDDTPRRNFSLVGTGISYAGNTLNSLAGGGLAFGYYPQPRVRAHVVGYFLGGSLGSQGRGFSDIDELAGELGGRYYLTSDRTFIGAYVSAAARFGLFMWSFDNPIQIQESNGSVSEIESDHMTSYSLLLGFGVSPIQTPVFHLGAGMNFGFRFYDAVTSEGFDNDAFPSVGFTQFYLESSAFF